MHTQHIEQSPIHERGGQSSYLLLGANQFGARNLAITWVDCPPGSWQPLHRHEAQEQIYVIIRGIGVMTVGDEERDVREGMLIFVPPSTAHTIRNDSNAPMSYVSATSPPFDGAALGALYKERPG
jgi:mannose-6-phosphate isomerase-like protein (cupin superfamily)